MTLRADPTWPGAAAAVEQRGSDLTDDPTRPLLEQLLATHHERLRRVARSYERDPMLSEDLFQDICVALWRALRTFRGEASPLAFALRVAHNRGASHALAQARRRRQRRQLEADADVSFPVPTGSPETRVIRRERIARLDDAIRELPLGLRQAVLLRLEGLAQREIGEVLGVSENAVAIRLSRARTRLEQLLADPDPPASDDETGGRHGRETTGDER